MKSNWDDATFRFCIFGSYGNYLSKLIKNTKYDFYFLDIGANQGLYSILAAKNHRCKKVIAFEPVPKSFSLLQQNIIINKQKYKIIPNNAAISTTQGFISIYTRENHSGGATLKPRDYKKYIDKINIRSMNRFDINKLDLDPKIPICIKIDVEGNEPEVINELIHSNILERINYIFFECNDNFMNYQQLRNKLEDVGFRHFEKTTKLAHYDVYASRRK